MAYSFEQVFAADPSNPANVARNAAVTIFAPGDIAQTPLTLTTPNGDPLANPLQVNNNGFGSAFMHATLDRVAWAGGNFTGFFTSYEGMKAEAVSARTAAQAAASTAGADAAAVATAAIGTATDDAEAAATSAAAAATAAANSAALVGAPADAAIAAAINGTGTATKTALSATIDDQIEASPTVASKLDVEVADGLYAFKSDALPVPAKAALLPPKPQKQMIQTFQAGHGWSVINDSGAVTNLNDTTDFAIGSQSVKITTNGTNGGSTIYKYGAAPIDFTNKNVALLIKLDDSTHNRGITVQLGSTGTMTANFQFNPVNIAGTDQPVGPDGIYNWHVIPWKTANVAGSPNRAAITDFSIRVTDDNTGNLVTAHVQAIAAVPIPSAWTNGCVSFDLDDGFASHYTSARLILGKYGFGANIYPVTESIDTTGAYMTTAHLQELQNVHGWTVGAHSDTWAHHNMPLASQTSDELENFVRANRKWLTDRGLNGFDFFAYPGGIATGSNLDVARKYYVTARTVSQRTQETLPASDHHLLRIKLLQASTSTASVQADIDAAYAGNYHLILVAHDIVASGATAGNILISTFQTIVDYVATKGIPVKTMQQVLATR